jgi:hypothetical protein
MHLKCAEDDDIGGLFDFAAILVHIQNARRGRS